MREGTDLSHIQVPAKITVVPADQLDQLVPKISRYANSQNAIAAARPEEESPVYRDVCRTRCMQSGDHLAGRRLPFGR